MIRSHLLFIAAIGAAAAAIATTTACYECGWDRRALGLGIDVGLNAVIAIEADDVDDPRRHFTHLAVGDEGTVVMWGAMVTAHDRTFFKESFAVGDVDLHAAVALETTWWVVGDDGMAAVSADLGRHWTRVVLAGSTADLRAIVDTEVGLVVVGDGVILVQAPDGTWAEAAPAEGDWGDLRDVHWDGTRVYAVGLGGVVWSAADPTGAWTLEDLGIDGDWNAIGGGYENVFVVGGADGTYLAQRAETGWTTLPLDSSPDLIADSNGKLLSSDGTVFDYEIEFVLAPDGSLVLHGGSLVPRGNFAGARSVHGSSYHDFVTVGEGGTATKMHYSCGFE